MKNTLILLVLSIILFTFGLGTFSLWQTDEVIYTNIAKEILETGDWVTLHFKGSPWFIHPPMFMWLTALTGAFFGFSNFVARIWSAIFGVIGVITVYYLGRLFYNEKAGFFSALVMATAFQYIIQSRIAIFDVPLIVLMLLAVYYFFKGYKEIGEGSYWRFYIFMGLAMLMKGPIGILLPVMIITVFLFIMGELPAACGKIHPVLGLALAFAIGGSWYFIEYIIHGQIFIERVIGYYTINRFTGVVETHTGPIYYYIPVILIGLLPWTGFLFEGIVTLWQDRKVKENQFILLWLGIGFVFFSLANTKLPGYIMSLYPFLALAIGRTIALKKRIDNSFILLAFISVMLLLLIIPLTNSGLLREYADLGLGLVPLVLIIGVGGIIATVVYFVTARPSDSIYILVATMVVFMLVFTMYSTPIIESYKAGWS